MPINCVKINTVWGYFMNKTGTMAFGIRTPIIKKGSDLETIVLDSVLSASQDHFDIEDRDIIGITEAVVGISTGNYASIDDIAADLKKKYKGNHLGVVFPILSRNRFAILLKGFARAFDKITVLLSFPDDEVGNAILYKEKLKQQGVNLDDDISMSTYQQLFADFKHPFTGVNMIEYYQSIVESENALFDCVLSNHPEAILSYTNDILVSNIHKRFETYDTLSKHKDITLYRLDQILTEPINGSGFNQKYGLLGSNTASDHLVKLFPNEAMPLVLNVQKRLFDLTGKKVEVLIYGDGAFKDPSTGIWELADPVVSPYYTPGLEGSPNELKLKLMVDQDFADLSGEDLTKAISQKIKDKDKNLVGQNASLGTTPRRYVDLIGSLCDLMSGSGDKGTPVIYIKNYFKNYTE